MRTRGRIVLAAVVLAAFGGIAWLFLSPPQAEPVYQGQKLSYWLSGYSSLNWDVEGGPGFRKATEAVRHTGTNGIPTMLKMLRAKDSRLKAILIGLVRKQRILKTRNIVDAEHRNFQASMGLIELDAATESNAVPALIQIYDENISPSSQAATCKVFSHLGPLAKQAVPSLLRNMTNADYFVRQDALLALGRIHSEPALVVPAMIAALRDPAPNMAANAVVTLGDYGAEARPAVPALVELLNTSNWVFNAQVKHALSRIDPEAAAKAGVK